MSDLPEALQKVIYDDDAWKAQEQILALCRGLESEEISKRDIARALADVALIFSTEIFMKKGGDTKLMHDFSFMFYDKATGLDDSMDALLRNKEAEKERDFLSS